MESVATVLETCSNWLERFILLGEQRFMSRVLRSLNLIRKDLNSDILLNVLTNYLASDHAIYKVLKVNFLSLRRRKHQ
jgi:hypothetical protein